MSGSSSTQAPAHAARPGRGPVAPSFAFPVLDRLVHARPIHVLGVERETPTVLRVQIERPAGFAFRAGQHALLRLETDRGPDLRPLSIASPPHLDSLEFATRVGPSAFKQALARLRPGDRVQVSRPMGGVHFDQGRPAVLVAGGVGITPILSVLLQPEILASTAALRLVFSNRDADDIPFKDELADLARRRPDLEVTWVLTSREPASPAGAVHPGRISESLLHAHADQLPEACFYVAGSAAMVADVTGMLRRVGVGRSDIRTVSQGRR